MRRADLIAGTPYALQQSRNYSAVEAWVIDLSPARLNWVQVDGRNVEVPEHCTSGDGVAVLVQVEDWVRDSDGTIQRDAEGTMLREKHWKPVVVRTRHLTEPWEHTQRRNAERAARLAAQRREREQEQERRERIAARQREAFQSTLAQLQGIGLDVDGIVIDYRGQVSIGQHTFAALGERIAAVQVNVAS